MSGGSWVGSGVVMMELRELGCVWWFVWVGVVLFV